MELMHTDGEEMHQAVSNAEVPLRKSAPSVSSVCSFPSFLSRLFHDDAASGFGLVGDAKNIRICSRRKICEIKRDRMIARM